MLNILRQSLGQSCAVFGSLAVFTQLASANDTSDSLEQVNRYAQQSTLRSQVTSVSQLSDVQPTDWAFQALQSLVERYGCIAGYPDGTYRGNRALTRYEFAAGLNACLDRVNELIATGTADLVTKADLATLEKLQADFAAELATMRGRVDRLEVQSAQLEANQFSTTTKLVGHAVFAIASTIGDNKAITSGAGILPPTPGQFGTPRSGGVQPQREPLDNNVFASERIRLIFDTSFTGRDRLITRLQAGNTPLAMQLVQPCLD